MSALIFQSKGMKRSVIRAGNSSSYVIEYCRNAERDVIQFLILMKPLCGDIHLPFSFVDAITKGIGVNV